MPRSLLSALTFLVALATLTSVAEAQRRRSRQLRVAVVADQRSVYFDRFTESLREEVGALIGEGGRVVLPEGYTAADGTENDATAKLEAALASEDVDVVIGLGPLMGLAAGRRDPLPKPVILPWAVPELQGLPREGNRSGRSNLAYVTGLFDIERDLTRFLDVVRFENVVAIVDEGLYASVEGLEPFTREAAERAGVGIEIVRAQASAAEVLAALPESAEAVHVGALFRFSPEEMNRLIEGLIERQLPSFTPVSPVLVDRGILATTTTEEDRVRRVRRIALGLERLLEGDDPAEFSVRLEPREELRINVEHRPAHRPRAALRDPHGSPAGRRGAPAAAAHGDLRLGHRARPRGQPGPPRRRGEPRGAGRERGRGPRQLPAEPRSGERRDLDRPGRRQRLRPGGTPVAMGHPGLAGPLLAGRRREHPHPAGRSPRPPTAPSARAAST